MPDKNFYIMTVDGVITPYKGDTLLLSKFMIICACL